MMNTCCNIPPTNITVPCMDICVGRIEGFNLWLRPDYSRLWHIHYGVVIPASFRPYGRPQLPLSNIESAIKLIDGPVWSEMEEPYKTDVDFRRMPVMEIYYH